MQVLHLLGWCRSVQIALVLVREMKRGSESPWHVWTQSLPHRFNTLMHWNQQELDRLHMNSTTAEQDLLTRVRFCCFARLFI